MLLTNANYVILLQDSSEAIYLKNALTVTPPVRCALALVMINVSDVMKPNIISMPVPNAASNVL